MTTTLNTDKAGNGDYFKRGLKKKFQSNIRWIWIN